MSEDTASGVFSSLRAFVDGIVLLPQDKQNACWYASMTMVYQWARARGRSPRDVLGRGDVQQIYAANNGLPWASMRAFAQAAGMQVAPLMTPTPEQLAAWLTAYGPLWTDGLPVDWQGNTAGSGHVVVLAGLRSVPSSDLYEIYVYDPWPPGVGHEGWRPISHLVSILRAGADTRRDVTFMHYP